MRALPWALGAMPVNLPVERRTLRVGGAGVAGIWLAGTAASANDTSSLALSSVREVHAKMPPTAATVSRKPIRSGSRISGRSLRSLPSTIDAETNQATAKPIDDQ